MSMIMTKQTHLPLAPMIHSTVDTHDRPRYVYAVHTRTFHTQRESDDDPNANNVLVVTARG